MINLLEWILVNVDKVVFLIYLFLVSMIKYLLLVNLEIGIIDVIFLFLGIGNICIIGIFCVIWELIGIW